MRSVRHSKHGKSLTANTRREGFTLVVIAALFTAFSVVATVALDRDTTTQQIQTQQTQQTQLTKLANALTTYAQKNGRLPCPAPTITQISDPKFGSQPTFKNQSGAAPYLTNAENGDCTTAKTKGTGTDQLDKDGDNGFWVLKNSGVNTEMIRGMVPIKELMTVDNSLTINDAFDAQSNRIMYVVNRELTHTGADRKFNKATDFAEVQDVINTNTEKADFVLVGYGRDKVGGIPRDLVLGGTETITCPSTPLNQINQNCNDDINFIKRPQNTASGASLTAPLSATNTEGYFDDDILAVRVTCPNGSLARTSDGQCTNAFCWGDNSSGQLGSGSDVATTPQSATPIPVSTMKVLSGLTVPGVNAFQSISVGSDSACAIEYKDKGADGKPNPGDLYCWGAYKHDGSTPATKPEMVNASGIKFSVVQVGTNSICAMGSITVSNPFATNGLIYCWGKNTKGLLGDNSYTSASPRPYPHAISPTAVFTARYDDKTILSGDDNHWCALGDDHQVYCWGDNSSGQLGQGTTDGGSHYTPSAATAVNAAIPAGDQIVSIGGQGSMAFTSNGKVYVWGTRWSAVTPVEMKTAFGWLAGKEPSSNPVWNDATDDHQCVTDSAGKAYCRGTNNKGQMGDATTSNSLNFTIVDSATTNLKFTQLSVNSQTSCGLASRSSMGVGIVTGDPTILPYCWGDNTKGQLGNATTTEAHVPTLVNMPRATNVTAISTSGNTTCVLTRLP